MLALWAGKWGKFGARYWIKGKLKKKLMETLLFFWQTASHIIIIVSLQFLKLEHVPEQETFALYITPTYSKAV